MRKTASVLIQTGIAIMSVCDAQDQDQAYFDNLPTVVEKVWYALGNVHGVDMGKMRSIKDQEEVKTILLDILDPTTGEMWGRGFAKAASVHRAIIVLGEYKERRAVPRLKEIVQKYTDIRRLNAVVALGNIDPDGSADVLYPLLFKISPDHWGMQNMLVSALSHSADPAMYAKLERYVRGEPDPKRRRRLADKLQENEKIG